MSDEGEKTCPLCAEEMDLTDQQLKPCKCGYQICVWCWHHIMDMAEKDGTEGRCPACRNPYNKEKVVGLAAKCERLVAEMTLEKKLKTQKSKPTATEVRKQLSSARVIQRNLVYVVGLPLTLADEELLQSKEYFGQYGKVLKVSISRTATGAIQNVANNSCSVYITYSKEEEAIRCIQSVHGFVLEGRPLKSCFGTTKYCHVWLRNLTCNNPACLYLHEVSPQDESFTKDESLPAYTRTRILQIAGATYSMQHRSGNKLPPPADDYDHSSSTSSGKPMSKSATTNTLASVKSPLTNGGSSNSLPSHSSSPWGPPNLPIPDGNARRIPETRVGPMISSTDVAATSQNQFNGEDGKKDPTILNRGESEPIETVTNADCRTPTTGTPAMSNHNQLKFSPESKVKHGSMETVMKSVVDVTEDSLSEKKQNISSQGNIKNSSSSMLPSMVINGVDIDDSTDCAQQQNLGESPSESLLGNMRNNVESIDENCISRDEVCIMKEWPETVVNSEPSIEHDEFEEDLRHFENQRLKDPEVARPNGFLSPSHIFHLPNHPRDQAEQLDCQVQVLDKKFRTSPFPRQSSSSATYPEILLNKAIVSDQAAANNHSMHMQRNEAQSRDIDDCSLGSGAMAESNLISSILSMDFDSWDTTSLTSSKNFSKLYSESDSDNDQVHLKLSSSLRGQNSNQSRFSFARHDDSMYQASNLRPSPSQGGQSILDHLSANDFSRSRDMPLVNNLGGFNNAPSNAYFHDSDIYSSGFPPHLSSNKLPVSRSQTSAPPGFSSPSRPLQPPPPPPGFGSQERIDAPLDHHMPGNHFLGISSLLGHSYQPTPKSITSSVVDNEFMDPAIMAVVEERPPNGIRNGLNYHHPSQSNSLKNDTRLQLLMQRSAIALQNQGMPETAQVGNNNGYFNVNDHPYTNSMVGNERNHLPYPQLNRHNNHHHHPQQQLRPNLTSKSLLDGWDRYLNDNSNSNFRMNGSYGNC